MKWTNKITKTKKRPTRMKKEVSKSMNRVIKRDSRRSWNRILRITRIMNNPNKKRRRQDSQSNAGLPMVEGISTLTTTS
jgi:hypothetical protein